MTNERHDPHDRDETVSRVYREVSTESTPRRLDDRVLREATRSVRSRYGRSIRWTRPLAWAATITLTVSIIVHMAELPTPEAPGIPPAVEPGAIDAVPREAPASEDRAAGQATSAPPVQAEPVLQETEAAPRRERALRTDALQDARETMLAPAEPGEAAPPMQEADMLQRASDLARQQESGTTAPAAAIQSFNSKATAESITYCDDSERRSPEAWYACIERLREEGLAAAADAELTELAERFPDFELP